MLRRVPPDEACGGATGFSPWGSTLTHTTLPLSLDACLPVGRVEGLPCGVMKYTPQGIGEHELRFGVMEKMKR